MVVEQINKGQNKPSKTHFHKIMNWNETHPNTLKPSDWNKQAIYLLHLWEPGRVAKCSRKKDMKTPGRLGSESEILRWLLNWVLLVWWCAWRWHFDSTSSYPVTRCCKHISFVPVSGATVSWQAAFKFVPLFAVTVLHGKLHLNL